MSQNTWQKELQDKRIVYLGKSLLNGGAHLPLEELKENTLRAVPGGISLPASVVKRVAWAISKGKTVTTMAEAEAVDLPMGRGATQWGKDRLKKAPMAKKKIGLPGGPTVLDRMAREMFQDPEATDLLLSAWWKKMILPLLEAQGIRGISWQIGQAPEVERVIKVKL